MPKQGRAGCLSPLLIVVLVIFIGLIVVGFLSGFIGQQMFGIHMPEWMIVEKPEPKLPPEVIFHVGSWPITNSMIGAWISIIVLVILSFLATRKMKLVPRGLQNFFEFALGSLLSFCQSVAGEKNGRKFFPVVATIFLFVITNAWLSLIPGFGSILVLEHGEGIHLLRGANTDINLPLALAFFSFIAVTYFGVRALRLKFLTQFFNFAQLGRGLRQIFTGKLKSGLGSLFFGIIDVAVGLLELLSYFIRIVSFTFRLFGNMTAGEILLLIVAFLVPYVIGLFFYGLEILVGFVQALVFAGLTLVFLTMAVASHEEHQESH